MELLQERIRREGRVLPGNIVKVDGFLNHRVDTRLLEDIADEFAKYFDTSKITVVLTAEASGIALATICAQKYGVPMLFAKKAKSDNIESGLYQSEVFSYTYKKRVTLLVSQEWLNADDHVLIIDDFMANGFAVQGLVDIVNEAGAKLEGIGIAVEKGFQGGGDRFRASGIPTRHSPSSKRRTRTDLSSARNKFFKKRPFGQPLLRDGIPAACIIRPPLAGNSHTCGLRSVNSNAHVVGIYD